VSNFIVVYDACVLYPAPLRDILLELATTGLFRAKWSDKIHDEWIRNVLAKRPDLTIGQLKRTRERMDRTALDALVKNFDHLIDTVDKRVDAKDRHVVAAAIRGHASLIVTANLPDFPADGLKTHDMEAQHPDEFLIHLEDLRPGILGQAAKAIRARLKNPPVSAAEYIDTILRQGLPSTAAALRTIENLI
jgi:hypothetical protein